MILVLAANGMQVDANLGISRRRLMICPARPSFWGDVSDLSEASAAQKSSSRKRTNACPFVGGNHPWKRDVR